MVNFELAPAKPYLVHQTGSEYSPSIEVIFANYPLLKFSFNYEKGGWCNKNDYFYKWFILLKALVKSSKWFSCPEKIHNGACVVFSAHNPCRNSLSVFSWG